MKMWTTSRVTQAVIGASLAVGISATLIILPSLHLGLPSGSRSDSTNQTQQTTTAQSTATPDAHVNSNVPSSGGGSPRATATPRSVLNAPTATPRGQTGQSVDLHGTIGQVDTAGSKFTYQELGGPLDTIYVDGNTHYSGSASSLSTLTTGRAAEVTGVRQSATTCLASLVNEASDNG